MTAQTRQKCPDDGTCHHECASKCFRVAHCGPLSNVYPGDKWPEDIRAQHGETRPGRIEWTRDGWAAENGRVNGLSLFRLQHPDEWGHSFRLLSPLIAGPKILEFPYMPDAPHVARTDKLTRTEIRAVFEKDQARYRRAHAGVQAVAEELLVNFARSILGDGTSGRA